MTFRTACYVVLIAIIVSSITTCSLMVKGATAVPARSSAVVPARAVSVSRPVVTSKTTFSPVPTVSKPVVTKSVSTPLPPPGGYKPVVSKPYIPPAKPLILSPLFMSGEAQAMPRTTVQCLKILDELEDCLEGDDD